VKGDNVIFSRRRAKRPWRGGSEGENRTKAKKKARRGGKDGGASTRAKGKERENT